jgi:phage gp36-like protein
VREAGALLPQLAFARKVEASPERKRFWAAGSAVQGIAAFGIAATALLLTDAWAGGVILACLAVLAVARSASSVSYKDALARTIAKRRRGAITGLAASSEIDASLAVRYDLPLAGTHDILTQYCVDIALYRLAGSSATMTEELRQRYEDAMKGLADIATGKKRLNIAAEPGEDTSESGPNPVTIGGPPRLFSREKMRGF